MNLPLWGAVGAFTIAAVCYWRRWSWIDGINYLGDLYVIIGGVFLLAGLSMNL